MKIYNPTILIVEDDPNDQLFMIKAFRDIGVKSPIHIVNDALEAIEYMQGEGKYCDRKLYEYPTFVMTDLKMPRADGFKVLQHLKENPAHAVIPPVVFSTSEDLDDIKKSYMLGASSYQVKPEAFVSLRDQLKVLYDYWMASEIPEVDSAGRQLHTDSQGKLGERYAQI